MTLHKLLAIQVALVMLIGLAMAYAYPPSRVWALIRAKQSPAHPSCSTAHKYKHSAAYDVVLSLDPLSAGSFNVSNCPWACASQTRRLKFPLCSLNSSRCSLTFKSSPLSWTPLPFVQHRMCLPFLNNHTQFGVSSRRSANSHLSMCSPGLRPESAPAAGHDRAWCHQAGGNPPSRRETPPPWATVSHEVSSTPPWRHRRLHQRGKRAVQRVAKASGIIENWDCCVVRWNQIPGKEQRWKDQCCHKAWISFSSWMTFL